jgi:hypothetical protein
MIAPVNSTVLVFLRSINNREIAILFWMAVFLTWLFVKTPALWGSVLGILKSFANRQILVPFILLTAYMVGIVWCLARVGFWEVSLLKTTIRWFLLTVVALMMKSGKAVDNPRFFKEIALENFKLMVVMEFLSDKFVLALPYEMILVPTLTLVGICLTIAKMKVDLKTIVKPLDFIMSAAGLSMLVFVIHETWFHFGEVQTLESLKDFLLPIILTLSFLPAIYIFALWLHCQTKFILVKHWGGDNTRVRRWAKQELIRASVFRFRTLHAINWSFYSELKDAESRSDVRRLIREAVARDELKVESESDVNEADPDLKYEVLT